MNNGQSTPFVTRAGIGAVVFFAALIALLYQAARILAPFFSALLWAAVIALALQPAYRRTLKLVRHTSWLAASAMTFVTLLLVIGPAIALLAALASQSVALYHWASEGVASGRAVELWDRLESLVSQYVSAQPLFADLDVKGMLVAGIGRFSGVLASHIGSLLRNTVVLVVDLAIMLIALFFFFMNGELYYRSAMNMLPFPQARKQAVAQKFLDTFKAVINGVFLIALGQGFMTGVGFALFDVPFPVLWGTLAAFLALLPIGGSALVWVPGALYLFLTGAALKGSLLAAWGFFLVSMPDNFLKPLLIGRRSKLPTFFLFLGILGGLRVYGILGILVGPLIVTLLTAFIEIYREEYLERPNDS